MSKKYDISKSINFYGKFRNFKYYLQRSPLIEVKLNGIEVFPVVSSHSPLLEVYLYGKWQTLSPTPLIETPLIEAPL